LVLVSCADASIDADTHGGPHIPFWDRRGRLLYARALTLSIRACLGRLSICRKSHFTSLRLRTSEESPHVTDSRRSKGPHPRGAPPSR
jgi:hypothetical protein